MENDRRPSRNKKCMRKIGNISQAFCTYELDTLAGHSETKEIAVRK